MKYYEFPIDSPSNLESEIPFIPTTLQKIIIYSIQPLSQNNYVYSKIHYYITEHENIKHAPVKNLLKAIHDWYVTRENQVNVRGLELKSFFNDNIPSQNYTWGEAGTDSKKRKFLRILESKINEQRQLSIAAKLTLERYQKDDQGNYYDSWQQQTENSATKDELERMEQGWLA